MDKYPLDPARIRQLPPRFSWLDQRLVTEGHLRECGSFAQGLYLFLAVVSDGQGLSYYADKSIRTHLGIEQEELAQARVALIAANLIIFQRPLYQLLSLDPWKSDSRERTGTTLRLSDLIRLPELPQP